MNTIRLTNKNNNKNNKKENGFTLVELLLVMAIIGILAGTIAMGMSSSRKKARVTSTLKTANNINAELADCYLREKSANDPVVGEKICAGAGTYPELNKRCFYLGVANHTLTIVCNKGEDIIFCDAPNSKCVVNQDEQ